MPRVLLAILARYEATSVKREGWSGKRNGELVALMANRFDVLITSDGSFVHHTNMVGRGISVLVLPTNQRTAIRANAISILRTLELFESFPHRAVVTIGWRGERAMTRLDIFGAETSALPSVPAFES